MSANDNLKNGSSVLTPAGNTDGAARKRSLLGDAQSTKREYTPRDLNDAQLAKMDHADWLEQFSVQMGTSTSVKMTPFRQGVITRLHWAGKYIRLLQKSLKAQEAEIERYKLDRELDAHQEDKK